MIKNKIRKEIIFSEVHENIINEMIDNIPGINSFSEAVRYAVLSMADQTDTAKKEKDMQIKINSISKNIDILIEMTAGGFDAKEVKAIGNGKDTYIYKDARKNVENEIQTATTFKSNLKKSNMIKPELEIQLKEETIKKSRSLFE
ncbi:hypothetical protein DES36_11954 [Alkalibaculum bacchi]|uniref:Uncharacterized protein n=1 Tax=Alkalibaculum bacchi TaxID=645887 RepID=A0A366I0I7_9FIRM|nr:hypothetical protein [Alkalibaculum bacchi]RBP59329.1 hypothetical protein DES36_11954 [Alkalibaculum bacchi]